MNSKRISLLKTPGAIALLVLVAPFGLMADELPDISPKDWPAPKPKVERLDIKASFIICMISDGESGAFVGTEDHGVYHYDGEGNVKQYTDKDGMGDPNAYALAIDKLGRLWAGNLNTGVSVFNGETWRSYDVIDGPIGERIFDIQTCPVDGDVWIATSAGITRYKIDADEWEHYTREDGLLEDQASSLAFKKDGTLIVGTQCHGLAIFNRSKNGSCKHSKNITAPERYGPGNCSPVPLVPGGSGLPTNQINQILVARDETIWIATPTGLVKSDKNLAKMQYVRGRDYAAKVRGLYGGAPKEWKECPKEIMDQLMPEDYITCVTEDHNGTIWIGTRQKGFMAIDPKTGRRGTGDHSSMGMADNYVSAILPMSDGSPLIGLYIGGVIRPKDALTRGQEKDVATQNTVAKYDFTKLPSPIKPPMIEELKAMQAKLEKLNKPLPKTYAAYYGEDWKTKGDWLGRTTKNWAIMCAGVSPLDREVLMCKDYYRANGFIGPNATRDDTIRRWCHWIKTDNPNSLWDPLNGYRRQAEWDDHGETYPWAKDGPDLWYLLEIRHKGMFRCGMYFFNKDGHTGANRVRDYMIEIYPSPREWTVKDFYTDWRKHSREAERIACSQSPLAKSRMKDFWGGVYKQFLLPGPGNYYVKIDRNYSFNTILSTVIVERLQGEPTHEETIGVPFVSPYLPRENPYRRPPATPKSYETEEGWRIGRFWKTLDETYSVQGGMVNQRKNRIAAYQMAMSLAGKSEEISQAAKAFQWQLNQWDERQRIEWREAMETAFKNFYDSNESLRKSIESQKNGPPKIFLDRHKWQH